MLLQEASLGPTKPQDEYSISISRTMTDGRVFKMECTSMRMGDIDTIFTVFSDVVVEGLLPPLPTP